MTLPPPDRRWGLPALLALLPLAFFWRIVFGGEVVYWGTPLLQFYPWRTLAVEAYQSGQLPLWNPWSDFGAPLAANLQTAAFSPLHLMYLLLPVDTAMGWTIVGHVALAAVFMYWLARTLGLTEWGAVIAALAYAFSGFVISRAGFLSMTAVAPWFPALMAATELTLRAAGGRTRLGRVALLAAVTGLMLVAGHIQLAFYSLVVASLYALVRAAQLARDEGDAKPTIIGVPAVPLDKPHRSAVALYVMLLLPVGCAVALGAGLASVQLLPTAELTLHSHRRDGPGFDYAMNYSLYPFQLAQVLAPNVLGSPVAGDYRGPGNYWEGTSYLGALTLLLALIGTRFSPHPARWLLVALAITAWLLALGRYSPIYPLVFEYVPGFGLFQAPARFLYWWTLAGALLAGLGMDVLLRHGDDPRLRRWKTLPLGAAVGIGLGVVAALLMVGPSGVAGSSLTALAGAAGLIIASAGLLVVAPRLGGGFPPLAATLLFLDLFAFGHGLNPTTTPELYRTPVTPAVTPQGDLSARTYIRDEEFEARFGAIFGFRDFGSTRAEDLLPVRQSLYPNTGVLARVPDAMNYDPLKLERSWQLRHLTDHANDPQPLLRMMGVGTVFDRMGTATTVTAPLPRAWFAPSVAVASGPTDARTIMATSDPLTVAVVEAPAGTVPAMNGDTPIVTLIAASNGTVAAVETEGSQAGVLVVTESWYPGWIARIDGAAVTIYPANLAFRAVMVPAGRHRIEFSYEPRSVSLGLGVSAVSLALLLGLLAVSLRPRRRAVGAP